MTWFISNYYYYFLITWLFSQRTVFFPVWPGRIKRSLWLNISQKFSNQQEIIGKGCVRIYIYTHIYVYIYTLTQTWYKLTYINFDGHGSLVCCSPCGCKELDMTEQLNWTEYTLYLRCLKMIKFYIFSLKFCQEVEEILTVKRKLRSERIDAYSFFPLLP